MYVLYYLTMYNDDEPGCELIAMSEDDDKLRERQEQLLVPVRHYNQEYQAYRKQYDKYESNAKKIIREFLERNIICVRTPNFHASFGLVYPPDVKAKEQETVVDIVVSSHWNLFVEDMTGKHQERLKKFVNLSDLTEEMPVIKFEQFDPPQLEGKYFYEDGFHIEEIKEI